MRKRGEQIEAEKKTSIIIKALLFIFFTIRRISTGKSSKIMKKGVIRLRG